jgi:ABC-type phosphate transport system substrate-binding protein
MLFIRRLVMKDSRKWNPAYRALADDAAIVDAVARDPAAIAVVAAGAVKGRVRVLAVSETAASPAALPEANAIVTGAYPLARKVGIVVDRSGGRPLPPALAAFLKFTLGPDGQAVIARSGTHLPLSPADAVRESEKVG